MMTTAKKSRPILFRGPLVRAILAGEKTETRRIAKLREPQGRADPYPCPFGVAGDELWVRETWSPDHANVYPFPPVVYRADGSPADWEVADSKGRERTSEQLGDFKWRPSIFMPRHASRITLTVQATRLERLQEITEAAAIAEGLESRAGFLELWDQINTKDEQRAASNPLVWVVEFEKRN